MAVIMRLIRSVIYQQPVERDRTADIARQHDTGRPQGDKNSGGLNSAPGKHTRWAVLSLGWRSKRKATARHSQHARVLTGFFPKTCFWPQKLGFSHFFQFSRELLAAETIFERFYLVLGRCQSLITMRGQSVFVSALSMSIVGVCQLAG